MSTIGAPNWSDNDTQLWNMDCIRFMLDEPDGKYDAIITDPPYGINFQSTRKKDKDGWLPKISNDRLPFIWWLWEASRVLKEGGNLICFCRWDVQDAFKQAIEWSGLRIRGQVIWDRDWHGLGDADMFAPQHDVIWHAVKGKAQLYGLRPKSVVRIQRLHQELTHPNEKPVPLMRYLVRAVSPPGGLILDPFAGSASTLKAARLEGRQSVGVELDQRWYDQSVTDLQNGKQTVMELMEV